MQVALSQVRSLDILVHPLQSLSDQGNLSNLTSFVNNAVLFIVAATHVINLTRSALAGDVGEYACPTVPWDGMCALRAYPDMSSRRPFVHVYCVLILHYTSSRQPLESWYVADHRGLKSWHLSHILALCLSWLLPY